ncbi:hypothetical protein COX03_01390 [Candidatus Woesebacteria bacterium CG22_combo_CG10-13_8_21_14_all_39_10]|uniref:Uncharacterized protein n=1 Tax=Candidatus Woesebacteria bacterium CG22_combo_CG10-13_8_21_14_all_39_10 TaxID=1975059 RepID=A0A2H0BL75_9BACT|nr:MAG: hypothetical protein COX03_01390 [Candidatus Woesebacteria bacterium CG22_combo_CG10-13_8_21_14_all_39_10]
MAPCELEVYIPTQEKWVKVIENKLGDPPKWKLRPTAVLIQKYGSPIVLNSFIWKYGLKRSLNKLVCTIFFPEHI